MTTTFTQNPYLFVVGCPRSGTTLMKRMLDTHPQIAITRETHWITRFFDKRIGLTPEGLVTPDLIPLLFEYHRFPHLGIKKEKLEKLISSERDLSYGEFVSHVFDLFGQRKGKHLVGDKTPGYVQDVPLLHTLWPKTRFVHVIRDGRDVCLSLLNWRMASRIARSFPTWNEDPVTTSALWWELHVRLGMESGRSLGANLYYELRYESLVQRPEDECAALCTFLGIPYDSEMTKFYEGRTRSDSGLSANRAWLPCTPGLRNWSSQMSADHIEKFEAVSGALLNELEYSRTVLHPKQDSLRHASRIRDKFKEYARSKRHRLPQSW